MRFVTLIAILGTTAFCASDYTWIAPSSTDRRSPCPMLNTLANHGYLPHDGLNISMADLKTALDDSINLAPAATQLVGALALSTSTTGNSNTFNLDDLDHHGILEHDGSLSQNDIFFGDNHSFNSTIWDSVAASFTNSTISLSTAIAVRSSRFAAAAAINPTFNMTSGDLQNSAIESALYMAVFADPVAKTEANTQWVGVLFVDERLPYEEGWTRPVEQITATGVLTVVGKILAS